MKSGMTARANFESRIISSLCCATIQFRARTECADCEFVIVDALSMESRRMHFEEWNGIGAVLAQCQIQITHQIRFECRAEAAAPFGSNTL